jgi:hypothetical protein
MLINKKNIQIIIKETLITTLFAFVFWAFIFNFFLLATQEVYRKDLNIISFFWILLIGIFFFSKLLPMYIIYIVFFNYKINKLCTKHSISIDLKNISKKVNFFWVYFFRSFVFIILMSIIFSSEFYLGSNKLISKIGINLNLKNKYFSNISIMIWILSSLLALFYIYLFYFIADKLISFYKKKKIFK